MSETTKNKDFIYEFGKFVLDPQERVLLADGQPVHLTDKVFDTLLLLIENNGRLLTKEEMMANLWEESFVEESNLAKNISRLRKILNVDGVQLIETLPRRGYRFLAEVKAIDSETSLLVQRNLRVKITQTLEDDGATERQSDSEKKDTISLNVAPSHRRIVAPSLILALAILLVSVFGFYFWKREKPARKEGFGAIRLTDDAKHDNLPRWTNDGRIRFFRTDANRRTESLIMNADGSNQTVVKDFPNLKYGFWSPDGKQVIFAKEGDKTAYYLANADGSNEIALPFYAGNFDWSFDSKQIVYQKKVDAENTEIFVYSLETRTSKNVTNHPAFDADPSFSPDGKQIVFAGNRDGNAEIYIQNSDGSNARRLTNHPAWDSHPVFSPDGTQIAFSSDREDENTDVYLMNTDGSNVRRLTDWQTNETVEPGCWSPDGTRIAFYSDRNGNDDIYVISAEVYKPELILADDTSHLQNPSYSPDGMKIVYQAELPDKSGELRLFDTETKQSRTLLKTKNADLAPTFSPDGTRIVFQNKIESNTEICSINTAGSDLTNLTDNVARDAFPSFSPDGKQIVFSTNRDGNSAKYNLYLMNANGSNQQQIYSATGTMSVSPAWSPDGASIIFANDFAADGNFELFKIRTALPETAERLTFRRRSDGQPVFSPDGKRIAFSSNTDDNFEIYLMNADGAGLLRLTRNPADDGSPSFSKDGTRIIFSSNRGGKFALYEIKIAE